MTTKAFLQPYIFLACGVLAVPGGAHSHAAPSLRGGGLGRDLASLAALPEITVDELINKVRVAEPGQALLAGQPKLASAAAAAPQQRKRRAADGRKPEAKVLSAQTLDTLLEGEAWTVGDALNGRLASRELEANEPTARAGKPELEAAPRVALPAPAGKQKAAPVVQVVIPAEGPADEDTITARLIDGKTAAVAEAPVAQPVVAKAPEHLAAAFAQPKVEKTSGEAAHVDAKAARLVIAATEKGTLELLPKTLSLGKVGTSASVDLMVPRPVELALFVRDRSIVEWDATTGQLTAKAKGATELYVVHDGRMHIVPVSVGESAAKRPQLAVPEALVSLAGVGLEALGDQATGNFAPSALVQTDAAAGNNPHAEHTSLAASVSETLASVAREERAARQFAPADEALRYGNMTVQLVDERSAPEANRLYPAADVDVHILGTEFTARTDATGHLTIRDVPNQSRFLARLSDKAGVYRPQIVELESDGSQAVQRLRVMRSFTFEAQAGIAHIAPHAGMASLCGVVSDANGPSSEVAVSLDVAAYGPYYFNAYGYLDTSLRVTGVNGRFCFYNAPEGPAALSVFDGQEHLATIPVALHAGFHSEQDLTVGKDDVALTARLAAMPNAHEQLSSDVRASTRLSSVDMVDLIPLGTDAPMMQLGPGLIRSSDPVTPVNKRMWALTQASEFEPVLYSFSSRRQDNVVPLVPRGFVDDMAIYAQVAWDPSLGTVFVDYGDNASTGGEKPTSVSVRLLDVSGKEVGDAWYFSDQPSTKALFFNVPAGIYSVQVETSDHYWLASDTVVVYNETVSYQRMGAQLRYRP